eukprot:3978350-Pyramimonas_sp.AAC.2
MAIEQSSPHARSWGELSSAGWHKKQQSLSFKEVYQSITGSWQSCECPSRQHQVRTCLLAASCGVPTGIFIKGELQKMEVNKTQLSSIHASFDI